MQLKKYFLIAVLLCSTLRAGAIDLNTRLDVTDYIKQLSQAHQFDEQQLRDWFSRLEFDQRVIDKITQPAETKPWYVYRASFVTPKRVEQGVIFWRNNAKALAKAQQRYGVPSAIIVGILGVETTYGQGEGNFSALRSLGTLAFDYPPRSRYFTQELTQFLLLCREQSWDPFAIKASYAAALGMPQFMPSSYRTYAVDAQGQGKIDLFNDSNDAIASVAHYLAEKGWKRGQRITLPISRPPAANTLPKKGILALEDSDNSYEYWRTFPNFSVIMKYNSSSKYAMAVYQLGQAVERARHNHF